MFDKFILGILDIIFLLLLGVLFFCIFGSIIWLTHDFIAWDLSFDRFIKYVISKNSPEDFRLAVIISFFICLLARVFFDVKPITKKLVKKL